MDYVFTRRTYNAQTQKFTNNPASLTRYLELSQSDGGGSIGAAIPADKWASRVIAQSRGHGVLVFVHGFNTEQFEMLRSLRQLKSGLAAAGYKGAVVAFDWPSQGMLDKYQSDKKRAKEVARFLFLDGLQILRQADPHASLRLMAHSLGAYLSVRGIGEVANEGEESFTGKLDQAIFFAADLDRDRMRKGTWAASAIELRAKRFTQYYSTEDDVLDISQKLYNRNRKRCGQHGLPSNAPGPFLDVSCEDRFMASVPKRDRTTSKTHNFYFDDKRFYQDVCAVIARQRPEDMPSREIVAGGRHRLKP